MFISSSRSNSVKQLSASETDGGAPHYKGKLLQGNSARSVRDFGAFALDDQRCPLDSHATNSQGNRQRKTHGRRFPPAGRSTEAKRSFAHCHPTGMIQAVTASYLSGFVEKKFSFPLCPAHRGVARAGFVVSSETLRVQLPSRWRPRRRPTKAP
ncbi:hypothetical protein V5799_002906 [Amblyomma americanum]|uniref:Uncharacterized protein n=1 Tax=Amblyomma americanum TaxID=6943 RepID=A0AAQ4DAH4_AMBAM